MKPKNDLKTYLLELVMIMVGVFLGILVSNWNANRHVEAQRRTVLTHLANELEQNRDGLTWSTDYHEKLKETIETFWANPNPDQLEKPFLDGHGFSQFPGWQGIGLCALQRSAYQTAIISQVLPDLDPELLTKISKTYLALDSYEVTRQRMLDRLFDIRSGTKTIDVLLILEIVKGDVFGFERKLLKDCDETAQSIQQWLGKNS